MCVTCSRADVSFFPFINYSSIKSPFGTILVKVNKVTPHAITLHSHYLHPLSWLEQENCIECPGGNGDVEEKWWLTPFREI